MRLSVKDYKNRLLFEENGEHEIQLFYTHEYSQGDSIVFEPEEPGFYWIQLDDTVGKALLYIVGDFSYPVPFHEKRTSFSPRAFSGNKHFLHVRKAKDFEIFSYRNLAFNPYDHHDNRTAYAHASANVETRGEAVFAARNAIDGITMNRSHGEWPYASWGINMQDDAAITIDFGREVEIDRIVLSTRADFPHDNWWKEVTFCFSDNHSHTVVMEKSYEAHEFSFNSRITKSIRMENLVKSDDPSPFPALTEIEIFGSEVGYQGK